MAMPNESWRSTAGLQPAGLRSADIWKTVGMMRAIAASESEITEVRAPVLLKRCSLCFAPPSRMERPSTSRMLPMIDPVIDALTTLIWPL